MTASKRWPLHPKPDEYQHLDRWIKELAKVYEINYINFCKKALGLTAEEISSLPNFLPEKMLDILAAGTGIKISNLRERTPSAIWKRMCKDFEEMNANAEVELSPQDKTVHKT